jgi:CheY-like chemotaxis protein
MSKILVIEDNADNLELVRFLLNNAGHEVLTACDGVAGLKIIREDHPHLILLDLAIPEIDGWEMAGILKRDPETKDVPLIALTAHTLPGDRRRALDAGCDGYISKPIDVAKFVETVEGFLPV